MKYIPKVLVVATSRKTRGGITSVIKAHESTEMWKRHKCHWCQTHRDGPIWRKLLYLFYGSVDFVFRLPFYDIVHIHTADYGTQRRKRVLGWLAKLFGKKLIVHLHSSGSEYSIGGRYKGLYENTFDRADCILVLSSEWRNELLKNYVVNPDKVRILYNPCPLIITSNNEIKKRPKYVLFAGTLTERKGYADLIRAFASIVDEIQEWELWLAGNGEVDVANKLATELGIQNRVKTLGWISGEMKDCVFRNASVYCLPSYSEGFPMGVLDAWAYGLPVVTTPVGGIPDIAEDGINILLFNPGDIDVLSRQLKRIVEDVDLRNDIAYHSVCLSKDVFNVNVLASQLSDIYKACGQV